MTHGGKVERSALLHGGTLPTPPQPRARLALREVLSGRDGFTGNCVRRLLTALPSAKGGEEAASTTLRRRAGYTVHSTQRDDQVQLRRRAGGRTCPTSRGAHEQTLARGSREARRDAERSFAFPPTRRLSGRQDTAPDVARGSSLTGGIGSSSDRRLAVAPPPERTAAYRPPGTPHPRKVHNVMVRSLAGSAHTTSHHTRPAGAAQPSICFDGRRRLCITTRTVPRYSTGEGRRAARCEHGSHGSPSHRVRGGGRLAGSQACRVCVAWRARVPEGATTRLARLARAFATIHTVAQWLGYVG